MNRNPMIVAAVMGLVCLTPFPTRADLSMTILRQTYHVWGIVEQEQCEWDEPGDEWNPGGYHFVLPGESHSYDITTSQPPASGAVSMPMGPWAYEGSPLRAWSTAGGPQSDPSWGEGISFRLEAYSTCSKQFPPPGPTSPQLYANAGASLEVKFILTGSPDYLHVEADGYGNRGRCTPGQGSLTVDGTSWSLNPWHDGEDAGYPDFSLPFDATRIYTLSMSIPSSSDGEYFSYTAHFPDVWSVTTPVPGAALLGLLGLACAGWRLRDTRSACERQ